MVQRVLDTARRGGRVRERERDGGFSGFFVRVRVRGEKCDSAAVRKRGSFKERT